MQFLAFVVDLVRGGSGGLLSVGLGSRVVGVVMFDESSRTGCRHRNGRDKKPRLSVLGLRIMPAMVIAKCALYAAEDGSKAAIQSRQHNDASNLCFLCSLPFSNNICVLYM